MATWLCYIKTRFIANPSSSFFNESCVSKLSRKFEISKAEDDVLQRRVRREDDAKNQHYSLLATFY